MNENFSFFTRKDLENIRNRKNKRKLLQRINRHRNVIAKLTETMGNSADVERLEIFVSLTDGTKLPAVIYRPKMIKDPPFSTMFHIPGSGFNTLNPHFSHVTCSHFAEKTNCQVIEINHRLAPEHPWPIGQQDVCEVLRFFLETADGFKIDKNNIFLSGYSSGGTLAAVAARWWATFGGDELPKIKHLFLISPVTDFSDSLREEWRHFEEKDEKVSGWFVKTMQEYYLHNLDMNDQESLRDSRLSPYWEEDFRNFPPTHILCGEYDRFLGDSMGYVKKLNEESKNGAFFTLVERENHSAFWYNPRIIEAIAQRISNIIPYPIPKSLRDSDRKLLVRTDSFTDSNSSMNCVRN